MTSPDNHLKVSLTPPGWIGGGYTLTFSDAVFDPESSLTIPNASAASDLLAAFWSLARGESEVDVTTLAHANLKLTADNGGVGVTVTSYQNKVLQSGLLSNKMAGQMISDLTVAVSELVYEVRMRQHMSYEHDDPR
jgi:hypothetical protein